LYSTGEQFEYAYDEVGNRTTYTVTLGSTTVTTYTYDAANRLTAAGDVAYTWDARGNLVNDGTFTYTYDAAGRLVGAQSITSTLVYTYNGDGLRVSRSANGTASTYAWDVADPLPQMLSEGASLYVPGVGWWDGAAWTYILSDGLGSVRQLADAGGRVVQRYDYTPFGETLAAQGTWESALRYTGEYWDADAGLVYLRARWYDPVLGRFVSADTIVLEPGNPQSLNRYSYVLGNPLRFSDPGGHTPIDICAATQRHAPGCGNGPVYAASTLANFAGAGMDDGISYSQWDWGYRENVVRGAEAVASRVYGVVQANRVRTLYGGASGNSALSQLWGLSQDDVFRAVMGVDGVTFRVSPQCPQAGCADGVDPGAWAWSQIGDLGEVWVNVNAFADARYAGFAGEQNTVHELFHGISQQGGQVASNNLEAAWADNDLLTRGRGGFAGGFPWQQSGERTGSEVFADMGLGWTYGRWGSNAAGRAKARYMRSNMPAALALAVANR